MDLCYSLHVACYFHYIHFLHIMQFGLLFSLQFFFHHRMFLNILTIHPKTTTRNSLYKENSSIKSGYLFQIRCNLINFLCTWTGTLVAFFFSQCCSCAHLSPITCRLYYCSLWRFEAPFTGLGTLGPFTIWRPFTVNCERKSFCNNWLMMIIKMK